MEAGFIEDPLRSISRASRLPCRPRPVPESETALVAGDGRIALAPAAVSQLRDSEEQALLCRGGFVGFQEILNHQPDANGRARATRRQQGQGLVGCLYSLGDLAVANV